MNERFLLSGIGGLAVLAISACGSANAGTAAPSATPQTPAAAAQPPSTQTPTPATPPPTAQPIAGAMLGVGHTGLGSFVADGKGLTLYLFEVDKGTQSTCYGACAANWPPLTTPGGVAVSGGASTSLAGTSKRTDGTVQVTYNGHPLYYFVGDTKPGDTTGEGINAFGGGWDVLSPSGMKIEKPGSS